MSITKLYPINRDTKPAGLRTISYKAESEIQRNTVDYLTQSGFKVLITSNRKRTNNTPGTPDIFCNVYADLWIGLETKKDGGDVSEEQERLYEDGKIYIYTEPHQALDICLRRRKELVAK